MTTLNVELGPESYPIVIEAGSLEILPQLIKKFTSTGKAAIIVDKTVADLYAGRVVTILKAAGIANHLYTFPAGEAFKNIDQFSEIMTWLIKNGFKRDDLILALGGGMTGDLAGFAAASFMRGIPYAQIPTTLLSQVDSSVGGKTGFNHPLGKNLIGAFYQPKFVLIDPTVLSTLDSREMQSGLGEVLKYGFIADEKFLTFLEKNLNVLAGLGDYEIMEEVITRCCTIKAAIVQQDEKESGIRRILNFGHTLGHAIEVSAGYGTIKHGEAVVYGMQWAGWISRQLGFMTTNDFNRMIKILQKIDVPDLPPDLTAAGLVSCMTQDKKQSGSGLNWVLLTGIGKTRIETARDLLKYTEGWLKDVQTKNV